MSEVATKTRMVTILSPKGDPEKTISFTGTKWSELKKEVEKYYSLNMMKAVESVNSTTLEHPNATVPEGDFDLYLLQLRSKSGAKAAKKAAPKKAAKAAAKKEAKPKAATKSAKAKATTSATDEAPKRSRKASANKGDEPKAEEVAKPVETSEQKKARLKEISKGFNDVQSIY